MWSRAIEVLLGIWLLASPFVFAFPAERPAWWLNDLAAGGFVILFGLLSFWNPVRKAHLLSLLVACWLIAFAYYHGLGDAPPASQNHLAVGLALLMFAVIPNHASDPPHSWSEPSPS